MPRAVVLTTAGKAGTTGGTFGDTLSARGNDSLSVANYGDGGAKMLEWWGMDDTSVAEFSLYYTRPQATHDQTYGIRAQCASLLAGSAAKIGAQEFLPGALVVNVFPSDTATVQVTTTASDNIACSYSILYDDLPGAAGVFISPAQAASLQKSSLGLYCNAVGGTAGGVYGTARALNADDTRLHADTWYAILGFTMQTPVMTVSLIGPDWGGQRIGGPGDPLTFRTASWFLDQSTKWGLPLIPCFNSNNQGSITVQVADSKNAITPKLDIMLYELSAPPTPGS